MDLAATLNSTATGHDLKGRDNTTNIKLIRKSRNIHKIAEQLFAYLQKQKYFKCINNKLYTIQV